MPPEDVNRHPRHLHAAKELLAHFSTLEAGTIKKLREELLDDYEEYKSDSIELLWDVDAKIWAKEPYCKWMTWLTARKEKWRKMIAEKFAAKRRQCPGYERLHHHWNEHDWEHLTPYCYGDSY